MGHNKLSCSDGSQINCSSVVSSVGGSVDSECSVTDYIVSPGGRKYYKPSCVGDISVPFEIQVFVSLDKGYRFYKEYAYLGGFGDRKGTKKKDKDDVKTILLKNYVCSCEGFNDFYDFRKYVKRQRTISQRCGCKAKIVLKFMGEDKYFIQTFVEVYNHPLATEYGRQFLRSNREMNISLRNIVFDASKVNIGPSKIFGFAKEQAGGYANVGVSLPDFRKFNRYLKSFVRERDGQMIIDKFKVQYDLCPFHCYGRNAVVIVTDQCPAMKVAIRNAFSAENGLLAIKHRLYMWHIMQKFSIKLGNRLCKETDFMEKMKAYIWSSVLEIDKFEIGWKEVIKEFKLEDNNWLLDMYCMRSSWIRAWFRDAPMLGLMRTTSRSESDFF
ncbi:protein FAR1-RELATED SEQUENCE 1-like [Apium graveolens]|uniref:protein FAR1-RELATED SEQUENCE 1-like n=1 Tax=Apium graveolens TaxID=4045 RepID=UPI003D7AFEF0